MLVFRLYIVAGTIVGRLNLIPLSTTPINRTVVLGANPVGCVVKGTLSRIPSLGGEALHTIPGIEATLFTVFQVLDATRLTPFQALEAVFLT